jgi:hypothetical protein
MVLVLVQFVSFYCYQIEQRSSLLMMFFMFLVLIAIYLLPQPWPRNMVLFSQATLIGVHSPRIMSCILQDAREMTCTYWILLLFYHKLLLLMPIVSATYHNLKSVNQSRHGITDLLISILTRLTTPWFYSWSTTYQT